MYAATSVVHDFPHTQRNLPALYRPKVPVVSHHYPFHCPVSWQMVPLVQSPRCCCLTNDCCCLCICWGIGCAEENCTWSFLGCKFSGLYLLTEIRCLFHHHLQEIPQTAQSFHMLCNLSPPLPLLGWLGVWQVLSRFFPWGSGHPGAAAEAGVAQEAQTGAVSCGDSVW